jgi:hypothetical protein
MSMRYIIHVYCLAETPIENLSCAGRMKVNAAAICFVARGELVCGRGDIAGDVLIL